MAIITLAEYKVFSFYNSATQSDAEITALIPVVETDYIAIQGRDFLTATGDTVDTEADINSPDTFDYFKKLDVADSDSLRGVVTLIDEDNDLITTDGTATATTTDEEFTIYPAGSTYTAARMINYQFQTMADAGNLKSESLEKHSVTYRDNTASSFIHGYPFSIVSSIKRYAGLSEGTITGEGRALGRSTIDFTCTVNRRNEEEV